MDFGGCESVSTGKGALDPHPILRENTGHGHSLDIDYPFRQESSIASAVVKNPVKVEHKMFDDITSVDAHVPPEEIALYYGKFSEFLPITPTFFIQCQSIVSYRKGSRHENTKTLRVL